MDKTRNTRQKQMILEILKKADAPLSINDIYTSIVADCPSIAKSTIYRNIDALLKQDLIDKYFLNDNELFYKIKKDSKEHKHYVICEECKKVIDLPVCPIHEIEEILSAKGFTITDHYLQVSGKCCECRKKEVFLKPQK